MTETTQQIPLTQYKRTKIIATIGPATNNYEAVRRLIAAGVNGVRLNFSHGNNDERVDQVKWIRRASKELKKPVAIIQDLQGPKIRLGTFEEAVQVVSGQIIKLDHYAEGYSGDTFPIQYDLSTKVKPGERLYIFDGKVRTTVLSAAAGVVEVQVENDGVLLQRKGINLPDTDFGGDVITEKDKQDIAFGATQDIDYVAMSFIQTAVDIRNMRALVESHGGDRKIIAKIETKLAIDNLDEIMQETDAAMVARGDMAVETAAEQVPIVQRQIVSLGLRYAKPTIVATQMLASMTDMPEPTRAEVSDVATAVLMGADCVMLSDETAMGSYPFAAVATMKRIILYAQMHDPMKTIYPVKEDQPMTRELAISRGLISLAKSIKANAIVVETSSGATAVRIASERPNVPLIAVTDQKRTAQQLAIAYDVKSYIRPASSRAAMRLTDFLREHQVFSKGDIIVSASGKYPGVAGSTDTIKVRQLD